MGLQSGICSLHNNNYNASYTRRLFLVTSRAPDYYFISPKVNNTRTVPQQQRGQQQQAMKPGAALGSSGACDNSRPLSGDKIFPTPRALISAVDQLCRSGVSNLTESSLLKRRAGRRQDKANVRGERRMRRCHHGCSIISNSSHLITRV